MISLYDIRDIFQYCRNSSRRSSLNMPGHIKLIKGAVDPDPTEFLLPSADMRKEDANKPYDSKKSVWIADPKTNGYREGLLESGDIASLGAEGADLTVKMVVAVGYGSPSLNFL